MEKFFNCIDTLPLVRILQVMSVILFVASVFNLIPYWSHISELRDSPTSDMIFDLLTKSIRILALSLYQPLVLLALAELIKLFRK